MTATVPESLVDHVMHDAIQPKPGHVHKYNSEYGMVPTRYGPALLCKCGSWGLPAGNDEWQMVPVELLPATCRHLTFWRHSLREAKTIAGFMVAGLILLLWVVL